MFRRIKTKNTYEATWYLIQGAFFERVSKRRLPNHEAKKKEYVWEWTIYLTHVSQEAIDLWRSDQAIAKITDFERERRKLKRKIKHYENCYS